MKLPQLFSTMAITSAILLSQNVMAADAQFTDAQKKQIEQIAHEYLLNHPEVLVEVSQKLQDQQEAQMKKIEENAQKTIPSVAKELINDPNSPVAGNKEGSITVVEFFDYQCQHCKHLAAVLDKIIEKDNDIRVVYKEFPIFGNSSVYASKAALAANKQGKYNELHSALMKADNPLTKEKVMESAKSIGLDLDQLNKDMDSKEVKDELEHNIKLAQKLGIMATPASVIGSTKNAHDPKAKSVFIPGFVNEEVMQSLITNVKQNKG